MRSRTQEREFRAFQQAEFCSVWGTTRRACEFRKVADTALFRDHLELGLSFAGMATKKYLAQQEVKERGDLAVDTEQRGVKLLVVGWADRK